MKKRYTEEQIIGFLREADAGYPYRGSAVVMGFRRPATNSGCGGDPYS